jgi:hypothetical protein
MTATRTTILATAALVALSVAAVAIARSAADTAASSDIAVIESDTILAAHGQLQLGAYSRFQWHHPGPLAFYLFAPFYEASGSRTAGLSAGAFVVNLLSLAVVAAILIHRSRPPVAVATTAAFALFAWRAAEAVASPWNPHLAVLPLAALIATVAATMSGTAPLLPLVAFFASLCAQAHVALLPSAIALGVVACAGALMVQRVNGLKAIAVSGLVLAVVWFPPIYEQATAATGNLTLLWNYFVRTAHSGQPFSVALSAWSDMLTGIVRPDFSVAHGSRFVESPVKWAEALALGELLALGVVVLEAWRKRDRFEAAFGMTLLGASLLALWSATRIDDVPDDHTVFWISTIGVMNLGLIAGTIIQRVWRASNGMSALRLAQGLSVVAFVAAADAGMSELRRLAHASHVPGGEKDTVAAVADDVAGYVQSHHVSRPLIRLDQDAWGIAAGVILDLQKRGIPVAVENDWLVMFTPQFASRGNEPVEITIAGRALHVQLQAKTDGEIISARDPIYAHATSGRRAIP